MPGIDSLYSLPSSLSRLFFLFWNKRKTPPRTLPSWNLIFCPSRVRYCTYCNPKAYVKMRRVASELMALVSRLGNQNYLPYSLTPQELSSTRQDAIPHPPYANAIAIGLQKYTFQIPDAMNRKRRPKRRRSLLRIHNFQQKACVVDPRNFIQGSSLGMPTPSPLSSARTPEW